MTLFNAFIAYLPVWLILKGYPLNRSLLLVNIFVNKNCQYDRILGFYYKRFYLAEIPLYDANEIANSEDHDQLLL